MNRVAIRYSKERLRNPTKSELVFKRKLNQANVKFIQEHIIKNDETFYLIDFYIPEKKICIEIDGGYHIRFKQKLKDKLRDKYLIEHGYNIWRMTNEESDKISYIEIEDIVRRTIAPKKPDHDNRTRKPTPMKWSKLKIKRVAKNVPSIESIKERKNRRRPLINFLGS